MKHKKTSLFAVPFLLMSTAIFSYLTLINKWNFEIASYAIFFFTLLYILVLERVIPLKRKWTPQKNSLWTDIKHLIFSTAIFDAFGKTLALSITIYVRENSFTLFNFWDTLPFWTCYIIANLIGDLLPYLYHRISHKGNSNSYLSLLLWKIHSIHHLPTSLNWFKTNWIHPINMFLNTFLKMAPILLLGFSKEVIFLVGITHTVIAYISHANIQTRKSFWDYLIVTPQIHHFHHSTDLEEAKNFSNIFPFWDLLFGTYYNRKGAVKEVGVMKSSKINYPEHLAYYKQLVFPITTLKECCKSQ